MKFNARGSVRLRRELLSREVSKMNALAVNPDHCSPSAISPVERDALEGRAARRKLSAVVLVLSVRNDPQICSRVVQPITVDMVNLKTERRSGEEPMHSNRGALSIGRNGTPPSVGGPCPDHCAPVELLKNGKVGDIDFGEISARQWQSRGGPYDFCLADNGVHHASLSMV